jgi:UDP-3-O-acyl-N-acetylglucosamine deacetylase
MSELPSSDGSLKSFIRILRAYGLDQSQANNKVGLENHRSKTKVVLRDLEE